MVDKNNLVYDNKKRLTEIDDEEICQNDYVEFRVKKETSFGDVMLFAIIGDISELKINLTNKEFDALIYFLETVKKDLDEIDFLSY